jgi:hypothetical protein
MKLTELFPRFLKRIDDNHFQSVDTVAEADGLTFICPKCFEANGKQRPGVHSIICWAPSVPQTTQPKPGRWELIGRSLDDLTLRAGSSSILLTSGCAAHFFITNGEIVMT